MVHGIIIAAMLTLVGDTAEQGQSAAQWKLGRTYADGDGVPRDDLRISTKSSAPTRMYLPAPRKRALSPAPSWDWTTIPDGHTQFENHCRSGARPRHVRLCGDLFR
jgi:hypothetical protein